MPVKRARYWQFLILAILFLAAIWQFLVALLMPMTWIGSVCTVDDTYLALEVGYRWAQLGYPTFDGFHRTSGFQPAWGLLLLGLAQFASDPLVMVRSTLVIATLLNTLSGFLLVWLGRRIMPEEPRLALGGIACWCAFCVTGRPALIGLESCLLPTVLLATILTLWSLAEQPRSTLRWLALAMLCVAMIWIRLDAAVLAGFVLLGAIIVTRHVRLVAGPLVAILILVSGGAGYIAFERWAGGEITPISGLAKRALTSQRTADASLVTRVSQTVFDSGNIVLKHAMTGLGCATPRALSSGGRIALLLLLGSALVRLRQPRIRWIFFSLIALVSHAVLIRTWLGRYFHDTAWYYAAVNVMAAIGTPLLLLSVFPIALSPRRASNIAFGAVGIFVARFAYSSWLLTQPIPPDNLSVVRQSAATWLRDNIVPDARIAAWNAGELAYFSGRTVVNLDGLMNDREFLSRFIRGGDLIFKYLDEQHVDWVIDYANGAREAPNQLWSTLPDTEWIEVRRFGEAPSTAQLLVRRR